MYIYIYIYIYILFIQTHTCMRAQKRTFSDIGSSRSISGAWYAGVPAVYSRRVIARLHSRRGSSTA